MRQLVLNQKLLSVLCALKAKQTLAVAEVDLPGFSGDWAKSLRDYFYALPEELMDEVGLTRNEYCISAIEHLRIPEEWMNTLYSDLGKFTFSY